MPRPAEGSNQALADATLTAYELGEVPADQPLDGLPRWKSSVTEIRQAAATLMATNDKLNTEARQLKGELDALQAQVDGQRVKKAQLADKLTQMRARGPQDDDGAESLRLREIIADRVRQAESQKEMLALLRSRRGSIESRVALARVRVAEAEVDRKSRAVDAKFQDESSLNALRAVNDDLREKIAKGHQQAVLLGEKTDELNRLDDPNIAQTRELSAANAGLRDRWAQLQRQAQEQQARAERLASAPAGGGDGPAAKVRELVERRDALRARLKDNTRTLEALRKEAARRGSAGTALASLDKMHEQNTVMEEIIGNLRENIALLEYKISTLQRYKDRNKAGLFK